MSCLQWLLSLFKKKPVLLPHPEEAMDPGKTVENTDKPAVLGRWLKEWGVPANQWDYWKKQIVLEVYDDWPPEYLNLGIHTNTPAFTWQIGSVRYLAALAEWFNPGVIAHEQAHNSYAMLTESDKFSFGVAFNNPEVQTDPLIIRLWEMGKFNLNSVEDHAEVYRFLGNKMPDSLKPYYPKLF